VLTLAVAEEVGVQVIGGLAGCCRVSFCPVSAGLKLAACCYSVAILVALKALDHIALTMRCFAVFHLMVMRRAFLNLGVSFF
jgi:hypothetical protein